MASSTSIGESSRGKDQAETVGEITNMSGQEMKDPDAIQQRLNPRASTTLERMQAHNFVNREFLPYGPDSAGNPVLYAADEVGKRPIQRFSPYGPDSAGNPVFYPGAEFRKPPIRRTTSARGRGYGAHYLPASLGRTSFRQRAAGSHNSRIQQTRVPSSEQKSFPETKPPTSLSEQASPHGDAEPSLSNVAPPSELPLSGEDGALEKSLSLSLHQPQPGSPVQLHSPRTQADMQAVESAKAIAEKSTDKEQRDATLAEKSTDKEQRDATLAGVQTNLKRFRVTFDTTASDAAEKHVQPQSGCLRDVTAASLPVAFRGSNNNLLTAKYLQALEDILDELNTVVKPKTHKRKEPVYVSGVPEVPAGVDGGGGDSGIRGVASQPAGPKDGLRLSVGASPSAVAGSLSFAAASSNLAQGTDNKYLHLQMLKKRLAGMLDEVDRTYKLYLARLEALKDFFNAQAGPEAATRYTTLALQAMSRHFRSMKDNINDQLRAVKRALVEEDGQRRRRGDVLQPSLPPHDFPSMRAQRGLPERAVACLRAWLFEHFLQPYPKDADKRFLARRTGLTRNQVSNWFINARVRLWKPMVEKMYNEEAGGGVGLMQGAQPRQPSVEDQDANDDHHQHDRSDGMDTSGEGQQAQ